MMKVITQARVVFFIYYLFALMYLNVLYYIGLYLTRACYGLCVT